MNRARAIFGLMLLLAIAASAQAPPVGDVLGAHNLGPGSPSPVKGGMSAACLYCHAPHSGLGGNTPLWSQTLSTQTYTLYSGTTLQNLPIQPGVGGPSSLCLSCHDGTVGAGSKVPYGTLTMTGSMYTKDVFGPNLANSHPFSLKTPLVDAPDLVASLASTHTTADPLGKVKLINGTVECNSCHEPHQQNLDPINLNFLVRDASSGQLCLSCHTGVARTVNGQPNPLAQWNSSIHAVSGNQVNASAQFGAYTTVAQFACLSCHVPHNAVGISGLLRSTNPPTTNWDGVTQSCANCHAGGSNLQTPIMNVYAEFAKVGHPFPQGSNTHDPSEPAVLINNRHANCADCHNAHSSFQVTLFGNPPGIRVSQTGVVGVSATDGTTVVNPSVNQYENCLRCHGTSPGKQLQSIFGYAPLWAVSAADRLNVIPQLAPAATSSHPVLHDFNSPYKQQSLRKFMLNLDGVTNSTRELNSAASPRIFCTDCHNDDDNREFGGSGPNGTHGSQYSHILERRYEFSQVALGAAPGTAIQNPFPNPSLSAGGPAPGPYALCAKCHDLNNVMTTASFKLPKGKSGHDVHVNQYGVSCSTCHTGHGLGSLSATITGQRLVNFDVQVVGPNGASPISYNYATTTCTLTCHAYNHNADGSVTPVP